MKTSQDFDPWAGKKLGTVSNPEGFDKFWAEHEQVQRGDWCTFLAKQEALVQREEAKIQDPRARRGEGQNRERHGNYQRYSRPQPRLPRARPTQFVAIKLFSRMIRRNVQQMQRWFIEKEPLFEHCVVPMNRIHSSLLLTTIPPERRAEAQEACREAGRDIRARLGGQGIKLICSGVGCFNGNVLFARIRTEPHEMLQVIHDSLSRSFMRAGFQVLDEGAKSWLDEGGEPREFKAHASFIKVSKALAHSADSEKRAFRNLRVTADDVCAWNDVFFGTQMCSEFELLDMVGVTRDGYYPCIQRERFHETTVDGGCVAAHVSLTAGPLRTARLRVERGDVGAGMELSQCWAGYLVERLLEWPGQPELREGDVIVGIGDSLLLDLEKAELERKFRDAFFNDAVIVVGSFVLVERQQNEIVRRAAERLLRPWARVHQEEEASDSASMFTQGGTRLQSFRYQLRTNAPEFKPDPLSQVGGDPWAKAAEQGHVYPEFTGSGTRFQTRQATSFDSNYFISKPLQQESKSECYGEERTVIHKKLREEFLGARSREGVLDLAARRRTLLSFPNRVMAISRIASFGWLSDELRLDTRLCNLLDDIQDDMEAVEDVGMTLKAALLSSLALALGKLSLRRPELFRALAMIVRRIGVWTFADDEITALLEGFSRSKLSDEVVFQEAARLVVARVRKLAPRHVVTLLTAFACSSIATEHLFFAAGDVVIARLKSFSSGQLAELADAFSRVRARHALLLEIVPNHFDVACTLDKRRCSVDALAHLFAAYADVRQDFGPDAYREMLADALWQRKGELSVRMARQILQAAARARWPNTRLLEVAVGAVQRDPTKTWEIEAMRDCFDQLRVLPPDGFPADIDGQRKRNEKHQGSTARTAKATDERSLLVAERSDPAGGAVKGKLWVGRLRVLTEIGAGVTLSLSEAGYYVEEVMTVPGQADLDLGDVILAIGTQSLLELDEPEIERRFKEEHADGVWMLVGRLDDLQQFPFEDIRRVVTEELHCNCLCRESRIRPQQPGSCSADDGHDIVVADACGSGAAGVSVDGYELDEAGRDAGSISGACSRVAADADGTVAGVCREGATSYYANSSHRRGPWTPMASHSRGRGKRIWRPKLDS
eukprot:TRINITY_DN17524_c0_g1_i1.p1 TRINITY_DN17524_c0_g1~~TRINITY_DN17524_c0_g1_i1.p1  ORF type:complete len:1119 (-),score=170.05 TRINITY_DN17524_c0_g1_i1:71-3427(-)